MEIKKQREAFDKAERSILAEKDYGLLDDEGVVNIYVEAIGFARRDFEEAVYNYVDARERVAKAEEELDALPEYHSAKALLGTIRNKSDKERLKYFLHRAHKKGGRAGNSNTMDWKKFGSLFKECGISRDNVAKISRIICEVENAWKEKEEAICTICDCGAFLREIKDSVTGGK